MNLSQLRIKLVLAAGVIGTALLGATLTGCTSTQTGPGGSPFVQNGQGGNGMNAQVMNPQTAAMMAQQGSPGSNVGSGDPNSWTQQNRQTLLTETQRMGAQQGMAKEDVIAMARSGMSEQQIALAVQQRGQALRATPGAAQYLAQNGVNPAVLGGGAPANAGMGASPALANGGPFAGQPAVMTASAQTASGQPGNFSQPGNFTGARFDKQMPTTATFPGQTEPGQAQSAAFESYAPGGGNDGSNWAGGGPATSAAPAPSWRPMSR